MSLYCMACKYYTHDILHIDISQFTHFASKLHGHQTHPTFTHCQYGAPHKIVYINVRLDNTAGWGKAHMIQNDVNNNVQ